MNLHKKLLDVSINSENEVDKSIATIICDNFRFSKFLKIKDLADCCHVSQSTITRFCNRYGLNGYNELVTLLKMQKKEFSLNGESTFINKSPDMSNSNLLIDELKELNNYIDLINDITQKLFLAENVYIVSSRDISCIIRSFVDFLLSININVIYIENPIHLVNIVKSNFKNEDILLTFISGTGNNKIIEIIRQVFMKINYKYCFTSTRQKSNFANFFETFLIWNQKNNKNNYFYRNLLVQYVISLLTISIIKKID
ncbi:hypothetical protein SHELI_v1c09750 [Spiroplasma helicoides]|uniref:HTH rpiR-type domain-containing protein n=1 Tax=Spiroplasma helicoides TaxID=216938 RepID=A0A1B3SLW2_9MOLU|nr:MurR/RpiR family transcriptional regulator [Spiroplasma helicoides]AOG60922.1 hypothetical protein SHELI_v1c09750 [Spiroplasma helicoides]